MENIGDALRHLWLSVAVRLEAMGIPPQAAVAGLVLLVIIVLWVRGRKAKKASDSGTAVAAQETRSIRNHADSDDSDSDDSDEQNDTVALARKIEGYCDAANWQCNRTSDVVNVTFTVSNGMEQTVFINSFSKVVEVVGMLPFSYEDISEAPHELSNTLMELNANRKSAFWSIYDVGDKHYYCLIENIPVSRLTRDRVISTAKTVRDGCAEMVKALLEAAEESD